MSKSPPASDPKRSYTMSRIKNKNTSIEVLLRKALWASGIRYRKNYANLPGVPDIAITKHNIAIFCDGEFWHGKDWEEKKHRIHHNSEYWINKIDRNICRDCETNRQLFGIGWTVLRFWGTDINKNISGCVDEVQDAIIHCIIDRHDIAPGYYDD
ncbi:MAG: very short patch repair endonuclease [Oscillospiraceae bacterium]|nr:very short patch repair endonuclease [Oscillospiraceae bacterium]